jgi:hypothetical protein
LLEREDAFQIRQAWFPELSAVAIEDLTLCQMAALVDKVQGCTLFLSPQGQALVHDLVTDLQDWEERLSPEDALRNYQDWVTETPAHLPQLETPGAGTDKPDGGPPGPPSQEPTAEGALQEGMRAGEVTDRARAAPPAPAPASTPAKTNKHPRATINARMLEAIQANPGSMGWNSRQWAEHLKCSKPAVVETQTWQDLKMRRERERAERAKNRRRKPKASDRRRD